MKRETFLEKMLTASSFIDSHREQWLINRSIQLGNNFSFDDGAINLVIAMEELSELQKEISKSLRGKGDKIALTEEIADVTIMLQYLKQIHDIAQEDINKAINIKLDRMEERDNKLENTQ